MGLVPAKCTMCGASIEVDPSQEAGICKHCGTAFITEKVINNYNTINVDKSVNIYLGGKGDSKKEERDDEIKALMVSLDYTDEVDTYKRAQDLVKQYPGSADAHVAAAFAIGELMTRNLEGVYIDDIVDYEMYFNEVDGKDVFINISYPLGLLDKAKKFVKNENEKQKVINAEKDFHQKIVCRLYEYYIRSNRLGPNRDKILKEAPMSVEKILSRINPPEDKPKPTQTITEPKKKAKFNFFNCFIGASNTIDWTMIASVLLVIGFIVCMCLPVVREWLLVRWFLFSVIVVFVLLSLWTIIYAIKTELDIIYVKNNCEEKDPNKYDPDDYTREKLMTFDVILTKDNYIYAMIPYVDDTVMIYHIIRRIAEDLKTKALKTEDVDWNFVYSQARLALEFATDKKKYSNEEIFAYIKKQKNKYKLK